MAVTQHALLAAAILVVAVPAAGVLAYVYITGTLPDDLADQPVVHPDCVDRPCPDLVIDHFSLERDAHVKFLDYGEGACAVQEGYALEGNHTYLVFTTLTLNMGSAALVIGDPLDHIQWFEYHACHDHWHFKQYAEYRLWTPARFAEWDAMRQSNPQLTPEQAFSKFPAFASDFVGSGKQGFCLVDVTGPNDVMPDEDPVYEDCEKGQGISIGWGDKYDDETDGQWIILAGVPPGEYVLEAEVNGARVIPELEYRNNRAWTSVAIP